MREAHVRYLLAAALVVVAGYGVYTAAPQADESPASATTPIATPSLTPVPTTEEPAQLAPGLTSAGVVDPWNLSHAHADALLNTSFTTSSVTVRWTANGSHVSRSMGSVRVADGGRPLSFSFETSGDDRGPSQLGTDVAVWRESNVSYTKFDSENETYYRTSEPTQDILSGPVTGWDAIYTLFAGVNTTTVEHVERNGTTRYRVVSTSQPAPERHGDRRSNYSLLALIDASGLVYRYQVSYDLHGDGRTLHVSQTWRLSDVGSTTPAEPAWVDKARNETTMEG